MATVPVLKGRYAGAGWRGGSMAGIGATTPALALVLLFFVLPVLALLLRSLLEPVPGLQNYAEVFGSTTYLKVSAIPSWLPASSRR